MSYNPYYGQPSYGYSCPPPPCPPPPCPLPLPPCPPQPSSGCLLPPYVTGPQGPAGPTGPPGEGPTGPTGPLSVTLIDPISLPNHQLPPLPYSVQVNLNTNNPIPLPATKWRPYYHSADSQSGVAQGPTPLFPWPINATSLQPCDKQPYNIYYSNCNGVATLVTLGYITGLQALSQGNTCAIDTNAAVQPSFEDCDAAYVFVEVKPTTADYRPVKYTMHLYTGPRGDPTVFTQGEPQFTPSGPITPPVPPPTQPNVMPPHVIRLDWGCSAEWLANSPSVLLSTDNGLTVKEVKVLLTPTNHTSPLAQSSQFIQGATGPCCGGATGAASPVILTHQYYPRLVDGSNSAISVTTASAICVPGYAYPFNITCNPIQPYEIKLVDCDGNYIGPAGNNVLIPVGFNCTTLSIGAFTLSFCTPSALGFALYGIVITGGPSPPTLPIQVDIWAQPTFDVRDAGGNPTTDRVRSGIKFTWSASANWIQQQWNLRGGNYIDPLAPPGITDPGIPLLNPTNPS